MDKQQAIDKIKEALSKMGCTDVSILETGEDMIVVIFNCKELTSFVADILGWSYSGIQLDPTHTRQYKIDFKKVSPI
jgi:hypothetical protein